MKSHTHEKWTVIFIIVFKDVTFKGKTKCLKHKRARCFSYSLPVTMNIYVNLPKDEYVRLKSY